MDDEYDVVKIGYGDDCRTIPIAEDLKRCKESMKKQASFVILIVVVLGEIQFQAQISIFQPLHSVS